ncbi:PhzF family phenazine biosynthesis protein [Saccharopolyspora mangrovi]|uniref:PhzF family phenazine biosynthesis isomerase n=1 Tax=Saccharopolyspora mangrovi TaxID=3082379 RepID=A0ABU6ADB5_9PSEU|nr:PhzF family phenazine biosynthesis isomerase [Saccharopolyspora sp. S2-29]MEB3369549.1 PhzF family phenazine biosynthesis isomerase [Saccharopolyspora sp. S2-29]
MAEIHRYAAFTTTPTGGNPAGVVLDARDLDETRMQQIAAEVGYSETAFALPTGPRRFDLRFFSPLAEVAFCGHATIATAVALAERTTVGDLFFDTPAGEIAISTTTGSSGAVQAGLRSVPTTSRPATDVEVRDALKALRWSAEGLDSTFPPHVSFGGNEHLVLVVRDRERLAELDYDFDVLKALMLERNWTTLQLVWRQDDQTFHARNPFPVGGVVEDPATGAAAAALGGYLRALGRVTEPRRLTIIQGEDMGRRSEITAQVSPDDPRVTVIGGAVPIPSS